jgi:penicillin-binding protein-related factor A (putative recombinase)
MHKVNRGKDFEEQVRKSFARVPNCSIDRLHDQMSGYAGSSNICDFIVYRKPYQLYLECKACYGNTLNFHNITDNQWKGLIEKAKIDGVIAGVMIWFIDHDETVFIPIQALETSRFLGDKSVNAKTAKDAYGMNYIPVHGEKKRVFFDYDMENFLDYLKWLEEFDPNELGEEPNYE